MFNLLSGVSPEIRVILLFGFIGLILLVAGSVLLVGLRRQAIENSGRFDIPLRSKNPDKPAKVKKEKRVKIKKVKPAKIKPVKEPKPEKVKVEKAALAAKPEKVKKEKPAKKEKPKKGGLFKKSAKPTGLTLLAAPVGSTVVPEKVSTPVVATPSAPVVSPVVTSNDSDDFDIPPVVNTQPSVSAPSSDDDFDFATYDAPAPQQQNNPAPASGPFGRPAPAGDEEW